LTEYSSTLQNKIKVKQSNKSLIQDNPNTSQLNNTNNNTTQKNNEVLTKTNDIFKGSNLTNGEQENQWTLAENHLNNNDNDMPNQIGSNNQTVNLRNDIEAMVKSQLLNRCLKSKDLKQQVEEDDEKEGNNGMDKLKMFRKYGKVEPSATKETITPTVNNKTEDKSIIDEKTINEKQSKQYQQFKKELEKRRYIKALRNIMIEKFQEKNIVIPNICSCGQLQRKLDKLIESKNVSVYSIVNSECANNCIYYGKTQEYHKALSDIITSVKNVKFENFNS